MNNTVLGGNSIDKGIAALGIVVTSVLSAGAMLLWQNIEKNAKKTIKKKSSIFNFK